MNAQILELFDVCGVIVAVVHTDHQLDASPDQLVLEQNGLSFEAKRERWFDVGSADASRHGGAQGKRNRLPRSLQGSTTHPQAHLVSFGQNAARHVSRDLPVTVTLGAGTTVLSQEA